MEVLCMENEIFYSLVEKVVERIAEKQNIDDDIWLTTEKAMQRLKITSKTTLQKFREEGKIRYSQVTNKHILYDKTSIDAYLDSKSKNTF